jgi:molecular chaperone DnaK
MKDEAAANAETDKKEKERVDKLNQADSVIFQTEKQLKEFGEKLPAEKRSTIESALERLKIAHKEQNFDAIDTALDEINTAFQAASQEMYNAQAQAGNQGGNPGGNADPFSNFAGGNPFGGSGPFGGGAPGGGGNPEGPKDGGVTDVDFEEVK